MRGRVIAPTGAAVSSSPLPIVAIVGRPNVGKSTLFNRFAGRRRALVEDVPGVTRDRIVEEVEVGPRRVLVVDTAGLDRDPASAIEAAVQEQARAAVEEADAILFVVDAHAGLLPEERDIARGLQRSGKPLAVAVNKVDHPKHEPLVAEFHALGLAMVEGISAEHGRGAWDLLEALVERLPEEGADPTEPTDDDTPRVALVGRPNVGKSSLLNRLAGEERVVVSDVPGTTRDAIDLRIVQGENAITFVDTAGIRRPGRRRRTGEQGSALMAVRAIERAQVALVLVDADEGFTDQDAKVLSLVRDRGCACALLLNKWDLLEKRDEGDRRRFQDELARRMRGTPDVPVVRLSAKTGRGVGRIFALVARIHAAAGRRVPTSELNRWLRDTVAAHEPAMAQRGVRRRPLKFFYATQTGVHPPAFALFCTDPSGIQRSYVRFLENRLRQQFDFEGTPLRVMLRRRRPEEDDG